MNLELELHNETITNRDEFNKLSNEDMVDWIFKVMFKHWKGTEYWKDYFNESTDLSKDEIDKAIEKVEEVIRVRNKYQYLDDHNEEIMKAFEDKSNEKDSECYKCEERKICQHIFDGTCYKDVTKD